MLLAAPAGAADPTISFTVDRTAVRLSDPVRVTLTVEGAAPLTVTLPDDVLDEPSAAVWRVRPAGEPAVTDLPGGRQRWARAFRADPVQPGDPVRLGFAPVRVQAGTDPPTELTPAAMNVTVTTGVTDPSPQSARPATGIEELPPVMPDSPRMSAWVLAAVAAGLLLGVGVFVARRRLKGRGPTPAEWAAGQLDLLATADPPPVEFAHRLSEVVRRFVQRTTPVPATRLTTAELLAADPPHADRLRPILEACDRVRFAPADLTPAARAQLLADARGLVGASVGCVAALRNAP
ncbi:MAG: hypothetical protein U0871_07625 [Gemmataceae bacterium]